MHQEKWLPFRPEECPEAVWDQLPEDGRRRVTEVFAALAARAARVGKTPVVSEEVGHDSSDS